jgi:hypothetical protein
VRREHRERLRRVDASAVGLEELGATPIAVRITSRRGGPIGDL